MAFAGTFLQSLFFVVVTNCEDIVWRFNRKGTPFLDWWVCQGWRGSLLVGRFCLVGIRLYREGCTFVDDLKGIGGDRVAIFAREEGKAVERIRTDSFLHFDEFTKYAAY